jgi:hypothetical protein
MPNLSGVAFTTSGRLFTVGGNTNLYEIVGGSPYVFAGGFAFVTSLAAKGDDLYVSSVGAISRVSSVTGAVSTVVSIANPFGLSFDALGNLYFINHAPGELYTYNFVDPPRLLANITPSGGTYTGFGLNGQLFWGDYRLATLFKLNSAGVPEAFATGFAGGASPPAIGPNGTIAQGSNAILVADGHDIWRIAELPRAEGVLNERSLQMKQGNGGWKLVCAVRYAGVDGSREHRVTLSALGPGIVAPPLSATVGPQQRSYVLNVPDQQSSRVQLTKNDLWVEQSVPLTAAPLPGGAYSCRGGGQDSTGAYLPSTFIQDFGE